MDIKPVFGAPPPSPPPPPPQPAPILEIIFSATVDEAKAFVAVLPDSDVKTAIQAAINGQASNGVIFNVPGAVQQP